MLVSTIRGAVPLFVAVKLDSLCVGSPHMVSGTTFPEECWIKAESATLELQEQPLFNPCETFEGFGQLN